MSNAQSELIKLKNKLGLIRSTNQSLIFQKKFSYQENKNNSLQGFSLKIISDSLARVINDLKENKVTSINLSFSKDSSRIIIEKVLFSNKIRKINSVENIKNIFNYFFGSSNTNFIHPNVSMLFSRLVQSICNIQDLDNRLRIRLNNFLLSSQERNDDNELFHTLYYLLKKIETNLLENNEPLNSQPYKRDFYYLMLLFCDLIFLRDILTRHFSLSANFENQIFEVSDANVHPDSLIAFEIHQRSINDQFINQYVGVSQLCCVLCGLFLHSLGIDFRGISKKYEKNWKLPQVSDLDLNIFTYYIEKINNDISEPSFQPPYDVLFLNKKLDLCQQSSETTSDDLCHFLDYFKKTQFTDFQSFFEDFKTNKDIVEFILILRKKFKCSTCIVHGRMEEDL